MRNQCKLGPKLEIITWEKEKIPKGNISEI